MRVNKRIIIEAMRCHIFVWGQVRVNNLDGDKEPLRAVNEPIRFAGFLYPTRRFT